MGTPPITVWSSSSDETSAIGGLIAYALSKAIEVAELAVTDGEDAYNADDAVAVVRQSEQERSPPRHLREKRLRIPNSRVESREAGSTNDSTGFAGYPPRRNVDLIVFNEIGY